MSIQLIIFKILYVKVHHLFLKKRDICFLNKPLYYAIQVTVK